MFKIAIPVIHVSDSAAAEIFYCNRLGFQKRFSYHLKAAQADPCYMGFKRDGAWLHASSFSGDGVSGGVVYIVVEDVDSIHGELTAKGVSIDTGPINQPWGNREMYVKDDDGNSIRFVQEKGN